MLRRAAGSSFVGLAEISALLDGWMSCVVEKMLDFTITMYFHTRVGFGQRSKDVIAASSELSQSAREAIEAVQRNKALNT